MRFLDTLRLHQWTKNLLLLVPALLGHAWDDSDVIRTLVFAFLAFGLAASGSYLVNDLVDLAADRKHPDKRHRPLAAGQLPVAFAWIVGPGLMLAGLAVAMATTNHAFTGLLALYLVLSLAYTIALKRLLLIDVLMLAGFYALRLLAGGAAADVEVSSWLLVFSLFFFVSLAFAKRLTELQAGGSDARAYRPEDKQAFAVAGPCSAMLSILVLALYVSSEPIRIRYQHPDLLWLLCPLVLYWVLRVWFITLRGKLHHDPVVFALRDPGSYGVLAGVVLVLALALR